MSEKKKFTYMEWSEEHDVRIAQEKALEPIFKQWEDMLSLNPLPIEWLVDSLQAGAPLEVEDYQP